MINQGIGVVTPNNADLLMGRNLEAILSLAGPTLISGLGISNNVSDPTNDIDFATGLCRNSTNSRTIVNTSVMTKQLDAAWAAGTNQGGRMSAAAIANATYFCFVIMKENGAVDSGFDISPTSPTLPTGYLYFRRVGAILREGGAIVPFNQNGKNFIRSVPVLSYSVANPGIAAVLVALNVPIGLVVSALFTAFLTDITPAGSTYMLVTSLNQVDTVPTASIFNLAVAIGSINSASDMARAVNAVGQVRYRIDVTDVDHTVKFITNGWVDQLES